MPLKFSSELDDDLVTVLERRDEEGFFRIRIGTLKTPVTIRLCRFITSNTTRIQVSHEVKTPNQGAPYGANGQIENSPSDALRMAVFRLVLHYRQAVIAGRTPSEDWLVEESSD